MTAEALVRAEIVVEGDVQGVGFRYFVRRAARRLGVKGFVENLESGAVKIVAEASKERVEKLVEKIKSAPPPIAVDEITVTYSKPTGEFKTFKIVVKDLAEEMVEGFATGASYFEIMFEKQDKALVKLDTLIERQDLMLVKQDLMLQKQDQMLGKMDLMLEKQDLMLQKQDQMLGKMDLMLEKQDLMLEKQDQMLHKQDQMLEKMDVTLEKQDQMLLKQDQMLLKQDQMLGKMDIMLEKQDSTLQKQDQMLSKMDLMVEKHDEMLERQDMLVDEVKGLRRDVSFLIEDRITRIERDVAEIKARLGING